MESSNQGTKRWNKPKTTNPRKGNNKEDNRRIKIRKPTETLKKKIHQKKLPSHRYIKKSTRRRNINVSKV